MPSARFVPFLASLSCPLPYLPSCPALVLHKSTVARSISGMGVGSIGVGRAQRDRVYTLAVCIVLVYCAAMWECRLESLLHGGEDGAGELLVRGLAAHVGGPDLAVGGISTQNTSLAGSGLPLRNNIVNGVGDAVGVVVKPQVPEEHGAAQEEGGGVGLILALDVEADVAAAGLEDGDVTAHVAAGHHAGAANKRGGNVGQNAAVQVGHDHDVELLGPADALHGGVVDDHVVALELGVVLGQAVEGAAEETVGQLHDVGLVDAGDLLAVVGKGEDEGELGDALRLGARDDLERLDDAGHALVLETAVLALGVLADDAHVDVLVPCLEAGDVLDERDGGVDVELLAHGHVEALVARPADGGVQDALQAKLIAPEGGDGLLEVLLGAARPRSVVQPRHLDLLPRDGHIVGLEDLLDVLGNLGANAVAGDEGDGVLAAVLGGLEDVGLEGAGVADAGEPAGNVEALLGLGGGPEKALCKGDYGLTGCVPFPVHGGEGR